jgi:multidrug efflux pump subunit AcrB
VPKPQIYDMADSILSQKISQIQGVGQVFVGGSSSPAVRVELNPMQLGNNGVGLEAVRTALANANANRPKGAFQDADHRWQISDNDQIFKASDYAPIIAGYNRRPARRCASPTWARLPTASPTFIPPAYRASTRTKGLQRS